MRAECFCKREKIQRATDPYPDPKQNKLKEALDGIKSIYGERQALRKIKGPNRHWTELCRAHCALCIGARMTPLSLAEGKALQVCLSTENMHRTLGQIFLPKQNNKEL
jgi:hypothetical protein